MIFVLVVLCIHLLLGIVLIIGGINNDRPEVTISGIVLSLLSIIAINFQAIGM